MQFLEYKLVEGWANDRYIEFLREYLRFLKSSPSKRKYQKWFRVKKLFNREAIDFFNMLVGVKVGRRIVFDEIGQELLEEIDKVKSDAELDYGPTMTDDGRRILAIDAETVARAREAGESDFNTVLIDRFVELNGYLVKFVLTALDEGFLAENEIMKRIQSGIFHGERPNLTQLNNWIRWMLILGVMSKVGFRLKLSTQGKESAEYIKGVPDDELLDSEDADAVDDEDEEDDDEPVEKVIEFKQPAKARTRRMAAAAEEVDDDDDEFDEFDDELDGEGLDLPPEPGAIDRRGLDPREEALLATLDGGPAAVTGLRLTLSRPLRDLDNLLEDVESAIEELEAADEDDELPEAPRPKRGKKKKSKKASKQKKAVAATAAAPRRDAVAIGAGDVAAAVAEAPAEVLPEPDELPIDVEDEVEDEVEEEIAVETAPEFPNVFGKLRAILRAGQRPAIEAALAFRAGGEAGEGVEAYVEAPAAGLLKNKAGIMRWWRDYPGRVWVTAELMGLSGQDEDKYTLFFCLLTASAVLEREASTKQKLAFFKLLYDSGTLADFYSGAKSLDEVLQVLSQDKPDAPISDLFNVLLVMPAFKRITDNGIYDLQHSRNARELVARLEDALVGKRLGPGLIWLAREGHRLGLWNPPEIETLSAVPDPVAIETAYRLGFVPTHYVKTTEGRLRLAEMLSRYFREAEDGEAPLSYFANHQGCQFNCPWTTQCPYTCREKDRRRRFA